LKILVEPRSPLTCRNFSIDVWHIIINKGWPERNIS
jgi:hypothetical protein